MTGASWRAPLRWQATWAQASWVGVRLMLGYRALELEAAPFALAALAASFALPAVFAALPAGGLGDRFGGSRVAFVGLVVATAGIVSAILADSLEVLVPASVAIGLGHLLVMVGQQTLVAHLAGEGEPDGAFATLTTAASVGQLVGPPLVTAVAGLMQGDWQARAGLLACLACTLLALPTLVALRRHDPGGSPDDAERPGLRAVGTRPGVLRAMLVGAAVITTVDLLYTFLPLWAQQRDVPVWVVGALLATRAAVSVLSRLGLARLVARFGRRALLVTALSVGAVSLAALPLVDVPGAVLVMLGLGFALGLPQPLTMSWITRITPPSVHGAALGARMTVNRIAQVVLPLTIGGLAAPVGVAGFFWASAAIMSGAVALVATAGPGALPPGRPAKA